MKIEFPTEPLARGDYPANYFGTDSFEQKLPAKEDRQLHLAQLAGEFTDWPRESGFSYLPVAAIEGQGRAFRRFLNSRKEVA